MGITICDKPCDGCGEQIYWNNGDIDDMTVPDIDAVKCPYCGLDQFVEDIFGYEGMDDIWLLKNCAELAFKTAKEAFEC